MPVHPTKHARTDHQKVSVQDDSLPRKRKKYNLGESPRRTGRKRVTLVDLNYGSDHEFEELISSTDEPRPKSCPSTQKASPLSSQRDSCPQIHASAQPYSTPTAPMIATSIPDTETAPSVSQLDVSTGQQSRDSARSRCVKLKFVQKPQTELQGQAQSPTRFDRTTHDSPAPSRIDMSENSTSVNHTKSHSNHLPRAPSPQQMHLAQKPSDSIWNEDDSNIPSDPPVEYRETSRHSLETGSKYPQANPANIPAEKIHKYRFAPPTLPKADSAKDAHPSENETSKTRSKIQVPLWIITRHPRYTEELWDEGRFQGTPLPVFIEELTKVTGGSHIERLKLTLRTPTQDTKVTVIRGAEDSWESAKKRFVEKLKETKAEAKRLENETGQKNETASIEIFIEPFYEQNTAVQNSVDEDEDEFEF